MATTSTIQANILKDLEVDSTSSTLLARALRWMNIAMDFITGEIPNAEFLKSSESYITTVADQATYSMPSDFFDLITLRDDTSGDGQLEILDRAEFDLRHPDPSSEDTDAPTEVTLEYNPSSAVHEMRLAPIPDDAYVLYAAMRRFHPDLATDQNPTWTKLETALQLGGVWQGSLKLYPDPEYAQIRAENKDAFLMAISGIKRILMLQAPKPNRIPVRMRRSDNE